jgi:hypothetical protein
MLPSTSLSLRHQRRNVLAAPKMPTLLPCGKSLQRQLGNLVLAPGKGLAPTPGKPGAGMFPIPRRRLHHCSTRSCTSYRLDTRSPLGKPGKNTTNSHRARRLSDSQRRRHHRWHQGSITETQSALGPADQGMQASQGTLGVSRSRAPEVSKCRRLLLDKPVTARLLPMQREKLSTVARQTILSVA